MNLTPLGLFRGSLISILILFFSVPCNLQAWELVRQKDNIAIYMQPVEHSDIKAFKAVASVSASMADCVLIAMDFPMYSTWFPRCKEVRLLHDISANEKVAYARIDLPWPARDREVTFRSVLSRDAATRSVTIDILAIPDLRPYDSNEVVRLEEMEGSLKFTPLGDGVIEVVASGHSDPKSRLPSWLVNVFMARLAHKSLHNLIQVVAGQPPDMSVHATFMFE